MVFALGTGIRSCDLTTQSRNYHFPSARPPNFAGGQLRTTFEDSGPTTEGYTEVSGETGQKNRLARIEKEPQAIAAQAERRYNAQRPSFVAWDF